MVEIFTQALFSIMASQAVSAKIQHMAGYQHHIALFMAICAQVDFKGFIIRCVAIVTGKRDARISLSMRIE